MSYLKLINHSVNYFELPLDLSVLKIESKENKLLYHYVKGLSLNSRKNGKTIPELNDAYCLYAEFKIEVNGEEKTKPFIFIQVDKYDATQWIISDQINYYKPSESLINLYRETVGIEEKLNAEKDLLDRLELIVERVFKEKRFIIERQPKKDESRTIRLGSTRTKAEYSLINGGEEPKGEIHIKPDFLLLDKKRNNKQIFIEVERYVRNNEGDVLRKLFKLHYLDKKVFYIFANDEVADYHIALIHKLDKMLGRRFKSLYYTTFDRFMYAVKESDFERLTYPKKED